MIRRKRLCKFCRTPLNKKQLYYCSIVCIGLYSRNKPRKDVITISSAHERARNLLRHIKQCQLCGNKYDLEVHHKNGDVFDNSINNLKKLCTKCHKKQHDRRKYCKICGKPVKGYGFCNMHYIRWKKYNDPHKVYKRCELQKLKQKVGILLSMALQNR